MRAVKEIRKDQQYVPELYDLIKIEKNGDHHVFIVMEYMEYDLKDLIDQTIRG